MDTNTAGLIQKWQKRNIAGFNCESKANAVNKILALIPVSASVGISGSVTLTELDIVAQLIGRGNKVFNQYQPGIAREEALRLRQDGASADYYLASPNAIAASGELIFLSANGHRIAGIANATNVILAAGINKITPDVPSAITRSRQYVTPLNCKRLKWESACYPGGVCRENICLFPEYKRMCCQVFIIEAEVAPGRLTVVLVSEGLGY
jgi:hypothetical protein